MSQRFKTPSRVSRQSNSRACLCDDGTYSRKCCDGSLWAQGIGRIVAQPFYTDYDEDYKAVILYAISRSYELPTEFVMQQQNALVQDLKSMGAWDKMEQFFYFQNNGSIEFASIDWKDPSGNRMDFTNAPIFVSGYGISIPSRLNAISSTKVESDSGESQSVNDREYGMLFYDNEPRTSDISTPSRYGNGYTGFRGGRRIDSQFYATNSFISSSINATDTYDLMSFSRDNGDYKFRFYQEGAKLVNYTRFANEYPANGSISSSVGIATEYMRNFQAIYGGRCLTDSIRDVFYEKMRFYLDKLKPS